MRPLLPALVFTTAAAITTSLGCGSSPSTSGDGSSGAAGVGGGSSGSGGGGSGAAGGGGAASGGGSAGVAGGGGAASGGGSAGVAGSGGAAGAPGSGGAGAGGAGAGGAGAGGAGSGGSGGGACANVGVKPALVAHRTSGVAPLAVNFHTDGSSNSGGYDSFAELSYRWDFGDPSSGTWATTGRSKNWDTGVVAGHVFEAPGSYQVVLTATDPTGQCGSTSVTITVEDPNVQWGGADTRCVSSSGNFAGCPGGCANAGGTSQCIVSGDFDASVALAADRRTLFRRGETFASSTRIDLKGAGPSMIGAFGTGPKPKIQTGAGYPTSEIVRLAGALDWRVADLDFGTLQTPGLNVFGVQLGSVAPIQNVTLLRNEVHGELMIADTSSVQPQVNRGIALVENKCDDPVGPATYCVYLKGRELLILGNELSQTTSAVQSHVLRVIPFHHSLIAHNVLDSCTGNNHCLKLFAEQGTSAYAERDAVYNQLSYNTLKSFDADQVAAIGPQDSLNDERVHDILIEGNHCDVGTGRKCFVLAVSGNAWVRNNVIDMTGSTTSTPRCISFEKKGGVMPSNNPAGLFALANTCFNADAVPTSDVQFGMGTAPRECKNNLLVGDGALDSCGSVGVSEASNLATATRPFVASTPTSLAQFKLKAGSAPVGSGTCLAAAQLDFEGDERPSGGSCDVGADEL